MRKKFFVTFAVLVLVLFGYMIAEAADVPDFRQVAGRRVRFTSVVKHWDVSDLKIYKYSWSVDLEENFIDQYLNLIQRTGLFELIGRDGYDSEHSNFESGRWIFVYRGPKKRVPTFETPDSDSYDAHLFISQWSDYKSGSVGLSIWIAPRLTYGGDHG